jgi:hypothetical protein
MKKGLKFGILALVMLIGTSGALEATVEFRFGIQGGFSLTNHWSTKEKSGNYTVESSIKDGFAAGGLATVRISNLFSLEGDVLFVKKGSNQTITVPGFPYGPIEVTYHLNYVEIPFLLRTHLFPKAKIQPTLAVGPYVAFLTSKKYVYQIIVVGTQEKEIEGIKSTDYGIAFGTGLEIPANIIHLRIDYRYSMGFVDLKLPTGPGFPEIELRNYCHSLMFGLVF